MLTLSLAAMLGAAAALPNYTLPPARPATPAKCSDDCASRYRIAASSDDRAVKSRALAEDGAECNVVRARICRSQPHTWLRTTLTN